MEREKLAFVVHRYGTDVSGGAEYQCRELAKRLATYYDVEVLTSCAVHYPWDNAYPAGECLEDGIIVRRFAVEESDEKSGLQEEDLKDRAGWREIVKNGPFCPTLAEYILSCYAEYKAIIAFSYPHYTSMVLLAKRLPNVFPIPNLHDEPQMYRPVYRELFARAAGFLFETEEERDLAETLFPSMAETPSVTGCMGMEPSNDMPEDPQGEADDVNKLNVACPYILYIGRVGFTKNFQELNRFFIEYKRRMKDSELKLIVIGRINTGFELAYHKDIIYLDFVSEEGKRQWLRGAKCLCLPSVRESLSIVLLEAMLLETPVLVNAHCAVTVGQCNRSNAGLYYKNYVEFETLLSYLLENPDVCREMGKNGKRFVEEHYRWDTVIQNIRNLIENAGKEER